MRFEELRKLRDLLARGGGPAALFMSLRDASLRGPALQRALGEEMRRLARTVAPERFGGNPEAQDLAKQLQRALVDLYAQALLQVGDAGEGAAAADADAATGVPERRTDFGGPEALAELAHWDVRGGPEPQAPAGLRVEVEGTARTFDERLAEGDLAELWRAPGGDGEPCVAKVAIDARDNDLLFAEQEALRLLHAAPSRQQVLLPRLHASFFTRDGRAGSVLGLVEGLDGVALRERLPEGVPPEHVIWIGRRLLSAVGFAHQRGVLHANIEPAHILVRPRDHRVVLIDWCYALIEPTRTGQVFRAVNDEFSAPEVEERGPPTPAADLLSIGRTMGFLLGAEPRAMDLGPQVPEPLQRFLRYLTRPSRLQRAQDAWDMYFELERVRDQCYGPHVFREFVV